MNTIKNLNIRTMFVGVVLYSFGLLSVATACTNNCPSGNQKIIQTLLYESGQMSQPLSDLNTTLYETSLWMDEGKQKQFWQEHLTWLNARATHCPVPKQGFDQETLAERAAKERLTQCLIKLYKNRLKTLANQYPLSSIPACAPGTSPVGFPQKVKIRKTGQTFILG